jgi:hypothetical protein
LETNKLIQKILDEDREKVIIWSKKLKLNSNPNLIIIESENNIKIISVAN